MKLQKQTILLFSNISLVKNNCKIQFEGSSIIIIFAGLTMYLLVEAPFALLVQKMTTQQFRVE
jgi:hypothetical protein